MVRKSTQTVHSGTPESVEDSTGTETEPGFPTVDVVALPSNRALIYWPYAKGFILDAFDQFPGEINEKEVIKNLSTGTWQLWVAWNGECVGAAVTCIFNYSDFKAVQIIALGAHNFEDWREEMDRLLDKFGEMHECKRVEFYGRPGWSKRLKNYSFYRIMMVRDV